VGDQLGLAPASLFESFIDVDGEPLLDRVLDVVRASRASGEAIWFQ
jgi:hypothetical protein